MRFSDLETIVIRPGVVANKTRRSVVRDGVEVFLSPQLFKIFLRIGMSKHGATPRNCSRRFMPATQMADRSPAARLSRFSALTSIASSHRLACASNPPAQVIATAPMSFQFGCDRPACLRPDGAAPGQMLLSDFGFFDWEGPAD